MVGDAQMFVFVPVEEQETHLGHFGDKTWSWMQPS